MARVTQNGISPERNKTFPAEGSHCESAASDFLVPGKRIQHSPHAHSSVALRRGACRKNPSCDKLTVREEGLQQFGAI